MGNVQKTVIKRENNADLRIIADPAGISAIAKACGLTKNQLITILTRFLVIHN